jgi:hypothetical protein
LLGRTLSLLSRLSLLGALLGALLRAGLRRLAIGLAGLLTALRLAAAVLLLLRIPVAHIPRRAVVRLIRTLRASPVLALAVAIL